MGSTCSNKIPALKGEFPCPEFNHAQVQESARAALDEQMTVLEYCPECGRFGFLVNVKPILWEYPQKIQKIKQLDFTITRECGHAKREFSIGF